ncbi:MAG TPA: hypothetical protein VGQ09_21685 [Chitinophagaceae bacterium]|nr:hypothetical protein [Chitinophagaceae bacterium]
MMVAITLLSVTVFIILGLVGRKLFSFFGRTRRQKRLSNWGIEADAVLLNLQKTGVYINNLLQVKLQMQVYVRTGRNFVVETNQVISYSDLSQLRIGGPLLVKYNPANTKEVMVVFKKNQ